MFLVTQSCLTLCDPKDCSPPGSSVHGILQARIMDGMACPPPWDLPNPGTESRSPSLQADSLPSEPPGKSINTVMGSLSLLQGIFPTQGLNPGLPHCRQILYQLSHQGSPQLLEWIAYPFSRGICQTQKLKWGLIHCRRILYQLSHQGYIPDKNTPEPWQ